MKKRKKNAIRIKIQITYFHPITFMTNKQNQNHGGENYLNIMSCYYICLCIDKLGKVLQIFCYKKTDTCFIMKKKIMVKKGKEDKWLLPKLSLMYMTTWQWRFCFN